MQHFHLFRQAALAIAGTNKTYGSIHREHGLSKEDWDLLTQAEHWNVEQRTRATGTLHEVINISLTVSRLPVANLPAEYVAAMIASVVCPANLMAAAFSAPAAYDTAKASGMLGGEAKIEYVEGPQMLALVMQYYDVSVLNLQITTEPLEQVDLNRAQEEVLNA